MPSDIFLSVFYFSLISQISCKDLNFFCSVSLPLELLLVLTSVAILVVNDESWWPELVLVLLVLVET